MNNKIIVVAGATGNLGNKIVKALLQNDAEVRVLVREETDTHKIDQLRKMGANVMKVNMQNEEAITAACLGAHCVVSALAGLKDVIIDIQSKLVNGAIKAGVPRFIPSDFSLDFTKFSHGENRNLDIRRQFHTYLDTRPIAATSVFNGAFMDMLTNEIPMIIFKKQLILYWGNAQHKMGLTTINDTAKYTALVAMDNSTPRYLRIAGDEVSPNEIKTLMTKISGVTFRTIKLGGLGLLGVLIKITKFFQSGKTELYPAWQGMQYMRNMMDNRATLTQKDNDRYSEIEWTSVQQLLTEHSNK